MTKIAQYILGALFIVGIVLFMLAAPDVVGTYDEDGNETNRALQRRHVQGVFFKRPLERKGERAQFEGQDGSD